MILIEAINDAAATVHANARAKGFWDGERNDAEAIALMHSELSEALEALRHGNPPSEHIPAFSAVEEEMADVVIRVMDFCAGRGLRLGEAIIAKHEFNFTRPHKHGKAF
jgi:NTP pyrophosphatase (non-canonical NTP hydrolase)